MAPARLLTAAFIAAVAIGQPARAVPPPPAVVPEHLARPVDGYDSAALFQQWRYWVEERKGPVTEALLAEPEVFDGAQPYGGPVLVFKFREDLGHFLTGDVRVYCPPGQPYRPAPGVCRYRLRKATVPLVAAPSSGTNPVSRWAVEAFDPVQLVQHLRRSGIGPGTDWWRVGRSRLFNASPSPDQVLKASAVVTTVDSRDCPALAAAVQNLDRRRLDWRADLMAVGEDAPLEAPPPHAVRAEFTLRILVNGGMADIQGDGPALNALARPVLNAADGCLPVRPSL